MAKVVVSERHLEGVANLKGNRSADDGPSFRDEFAALARQWADETAHVSSPAKQTSHPAYLRIVSKGPMAIPLILRELEKKPLFWFTALTAITGEQPVRESDYGDIRAMRDAWLRWGRERGYLQ